MNAASKHPACMYTLIYYKNLITMINNNFYVDGRCFDLTR